MSRKIKDTMWVPSKDGKLDEFIDIVINNLSDYTSKIGCREADVISLEDDLDIYFDDRGLSKPNNLCTRIKNNSIDITLAGRLIFVGGDNTSLNFNKYTHSYLKSMIREPYVTMSRSL